LLKISCHAFAFQRLFSNTLKNYASRFAGPPLIFRFQLAGFARVAVFFAFATDCAASMPPEPDCRYFFRYAFYNTPAGFQPFSAFSSIFSRHADTPPLIELRHFH